MSPLLSGVASTIVAFKETFFYDGESWSAGPDLPLPIQSCQATPVNEEGTKVIIAAGQSVQTCIYLCSHPFLFEGSHIAYSLF